MTTRKRILSLLLSASTILCTLPSPPTLTQNELTIKNVQAATAPPQPSTAVTSGSVIPKNITTGSSVAPAPINTVTTTASAVTTTATATTVPTTAVPTTAVPTTAIPTTAVPTTAVPTTAVPTTSVPVTSVPTPTPKPTITPSISDTVINETLKGSTYSSDYITVLFSTKYLTDTTYQINDEEPVAFTENKKITIGKDTAYDEVTTIRISGISTIGDKKEFTKTFSYQRCANPYENEFSKYYL